MLNLCGVAAVLVLLHGAATATASHPEEGCHVDRVGDGVCDYHANNLARCDWDGGDCCTETCVGTCGWVASSGRWMALPASYCHDPSVLTGRADPAPGTPTETDPPTWMDDDREDGRQAMMLTAVYIIMIAILVTTSLTFFAYLRSVRSLESLRRAQAAAAQRKREASPADLEAADAAVKRLASDAATAAYAEASCPICFDDLDHHDHHDHHDHEGDESDDKKGAVALRCGHAFHHECLTPWFALIVADALAAGGAPEAAFTCPVCRAACQAPDADAPDAEAPDAPS